MPGFLSSRKGVSLLLIPEYSGINKGQRVPDRSKTAHRKPGVKCFLTLSNSLWSNGLQHDRPPCPSLMPRVYPNSCPLSWWCHPAISSSVIPFSSRLQSFPSSGSFPMSQFFTSGGQSIGVSTSASVLPTNIQDSSPLGWTGWITLLSKGLSRVFSNTTVQKHQFCSAQFSLWSSSHIRACPHTGQDVR